MKRIFSKIWDNILFLETIFLLAFIPLFPKLPILDIKNTWVYVRAEDFIVVFVFISWLILFIQKKITLKTPLTIPILIFWIVGGVATLHGVLLIFPTIANVFPNVAFLSLLRHIEYMSLFFIAFHGIKSRKQIYYVIGTIIITLIGVIGYGFGQKYFGLPAYLTMNEEFAKGIPIQLSSLSRVPSTFGGHYDLAAYLVFVIPILVSLFFGVRNWIIKIFLLVTSGFGFLLLFMTVSRVSFLVLFASLLIVLFFQKKKLVFLSIPIGIIAVIFLMTTQSSLFERFNSTVSEVNVLVDSRTGESVGHVKFVPKEYFADKIVLQRSVKDKLELATALAGMGQDQAYSTASAVLPYRFIPEEVAVVNAVNLSTGENLPQGTGYINLSLSPVKQRLNYFIYELPPDVLANPLNSKADAIIFRGPFIVKKAAAYDLSFTTRFQGEWPHAIEAFKKNIFLGSGYGSVSLAVDNNYLRILGEIGLLGFLSYFVIFLCLGIYIRKLYKDVDSKVVKSFVLGYAAGVIGLALNATLIDVFEASKIAFLLWTVSGVVIATLLLYNKREVNLLGEIKNTVSSPYIIVSALFLLSLVLFAPILNNFFVGDDFTWFRWVADCSGNCSIPSTITHYFTDAGGFFYRPGTKIYFFVMYSMFWLNQVIYHMVSIMLHFAVVALFYFLARKIIKNNLMAVFAALLFLIMSGALEAVFWISTTGYLFSAVFGLSSLLLFIKWCEGKKPYFLVGSFVSILFALMFHEMGVVYPVLIAGYALIYQNQGGVKNLLKRKDTAFLFTPVVFYLLMRFTASSHWFSGDYSYDILKLPFNFVGNALGYLSLTIAGPMALPIIGSLREFGRNNILLMPVLIPFGIFLTYYGYKFIQKNIALAERRIIAFGVLFFIVSLLPFLGLGNLTSRYSYLASLGLILIFVVVVKKLYEYIRENSGRDIAVGVISVFIIIFSLFHIIQVQQTYFYWNEAGSKAKNFFLSLDALYANNWSSQDTQFHFIDVPIKVGEAWVFPVGIEDALWFTIRNKDARVFKHKDLRIGLEQVGTDPSKRLFKFNPDGSLREIDHYSP